MRRALLLPLALAACSGDPAPTPNATATTGITLPEETAALPVTPAGTLVTTHCTACHSPDFITGQPPLDAAKWKAEVVKMREAYHAPIAPADDPALVEALLSLQRDKR